MEIDSADWSSLVRRASPAPDRTPIFDARGNVVDFTGSVEAIDDQDGWVYQAIVQGIPFSGDHVVIEDGLDGTAIVSVWDDDAGDQPAGEFAAMVCTLHPRIGEWSYPSGDGVATHKGFFQEVKLFLGNTRRKRMLDAGDVPQSSGGNAIVKPYGQFSPPAVAPVHGIWVLSSLSRALAAQPYPQWREWLVQ